MNGDLRRAVVRLKEGSTRRLFGIIVELRRRYMQIPPESSRFVFERRAQENAHT